MKEISEDQSPIVNDEPIKKYLAFLRDIDARWEQDHNEGRAKKKRDRRRPDYTPPTMTFRLQ